MRKTSPTLLESCSKKSSTFLLTNVRQSEMMISVMPKTITIRPSVDDRKIIDRLAAKLGIKTSQVIKVALRRLAEAEKLRLRAS